MDNTVLIGSYQGKQCAALLEGKRLVEVLCAESEADNIYVGRVETVLPGMQAAFVNIGLDKNAFLPAEEVPDKSLLKPGAELAVQTVKVPGGTKGVRVSGYIKLPGRMCVLMPQSMGIGVSKRITDAVENERLRLSAEKVCPEGMGIIVRTNACGMSEAELQSDISALTSKWVELSKRLAHAKAPRFVYSGNEIAEKTARDLVNADTSLVLVEDETIYEDMCRLLPAANIKKHTSEIALFNLYSVPSQIDRALSRKVWLDCGGYLVIDYTEALTVIDVNSGKFTGSRNLDDTAFRLNIEAAEEAARQLRLRDIGGIIIIDFVDMNTQSEKDELLKTLRTALTGDRAHTNVVDITPLGLVEITRKRKRERINEIFSLEVNK